MRKTTHPTPYPHLNAVLRQLVSSVQTTLGSSFVGAYLQGSFAVGDFDRHSDVDFIIVIEEDLTGAQVDALQSLHARIYRLDCAWAQHLEGSYFPREILKHYSRRGTPLWYLDNGSQSLIEAGHDNSLVVRWVVRAHGVTLAGPDPATLVDEIPIPALRQEILEVMNRWGQQILADPNCINNRFYQGFAVLTYCRTLHDLHTGFPGSKRAAAEWAKTTLDPSWAGLIDRAWATRPNPAVSVRQPPDPQDFQSTLEFVRYSLQMASRAASAMGIEEQPP